MVKLLRETESIFKLCLLAFFLLLIWTGHTYPQKSRLFPEILSGLGIIFIVISFAIQAFRKARGKKQLEKIEEPRRELLPSDVLENKRRWMEEMEEKSGEDAGYTLLEEDKRKKRIYQAILIILISLGIGYLGGFLLSVPFYFIAFGVLHGERKKALKYVIIALAITLLTYLSFSSLMRVPLLRGILWD